MKETAVVSLLFTCSCFVLVLMALRYFGAMADYARPDVAHLLGFLDNLAGSTDVRKARRRCRYGDIVLRDVQREPGCPCA